jgi:spoIIIJ-associated protein
VKVSASVEDDTVRVGLDGPDGGLLSADDGRVLEALQYLVSKMTSRLLSDNVRVLIDADGFRRERDEALRERAREAAHRARDERRKLRLDPLNPYERRVVHLALKEIEGVRTYSIGRGYLKRVTIEPVEEGSEDGVTAAAAGGALAAGAAGAAAASGLDETESGRRRSRRAPQDEEELESRSKTGEEE